LQRAGIAHADKVRLVLSDEQYADVTTRRADGESWAGLARAYGMTQTTLMAAYARQTAAKRQDGQQCCRYRSKRNDRNRSNRPIRVLRLHRRTGVLWANGIADEPPATAAERKFWPGDVVEDDGVNTMTETRPVYHADLAGLATERRRALTLRRAQRRGRGRGRAVRLVADIAASATYWR
jgi:hypothetical protein